jgi:hypothetical protein
MIAKILSWLETDTGEIFAGVFAAIALIVMSCN